jgi:hypothetical protein
MTEILRDGSTRLTGTDCSFIFTRLKPGLMLTSISGRDTGDLGTAPLDFMEAEYSRFSEPIEWFVDAKAAPNAVGKVFRQWIEWLVSHRRLLKRVHILVRTKPAELTMAIARHLTDAHGAMVIYTEVEPFREALAQQAGSARPLPSPERFTERATAIQRTVGPDGSTQLVADDCTFAYKRIAPSIVLTTVQGNDTGMLGTAPLDEMQSEIDKVNEPIRWFIDARDARGAAPHVVAEWTRWFLAHRKALAKVTILASSAPVLSFKFEVAKFRPGTGSLIQIYTAAEDFERSIRTHSK